MMRQLSRVGWTWLTATALATSLLAASPVSGEPVQAPVKPGGFVGWLELSEALREGPPRFAWDAAAESEHSLAGVLDKLRYVAEHDDYVGLVIYLDEPALEFSQIDELAGAIAAVRQSGKKVFSFAEHYDLSGYLLACATDGIILQRKGEIQLAGLGVEEMYLKGLLEKVGVKADLLQVGEFKGAADTLTRAEPSPEWSRNMDALLDDLYQQVLARISAARGLTPAEVEQLFADCWTLSDEQFVERKLVDHLSNRDLTQVTGQAFGNHFFWDADLGVQDSAPAMDNPFALMRMLFQPQTAQVTRPSVAVIHAQGPITGGESSDGGMFGGESIGSRSLVRALREVREDDMIRGAVIRLNSPGGSANASEVIWQAIHDLAEHKPVFVSIGSMAASGGYYMASAGDRIYAAPNTIVGSIGVVGGKLVLGDLYEKVGLTVHRRTRGPGADMFNSVEPFTAQQRATLESAFRRTYALFVERVQAGRGERLPDVEAVARGRIFTGQQALANGMVDKVGGLGMAVRDLAGQVGLAEGGYDVLNLPAPRSFAEMLDRMFMSARPGMASEHAGVLDAARHLLGPRGWEPVRDMINGVMLLRNEPVLTLMPAAIVVK